MNSLLSSCGGWLTALSRASASKYRWQGKKSQYHRLPASASNTNADHLRRNWNFRSSGRLRGRPYRYTEFCGATKESINEWQQCHPSPRHVELHRRRALPGREHHRHARPGDLWQLRESEHANPEAMPNMQFSTPNPHFSTSVDCPSALAGCRLQGNWWTAAAKPSFMRSGQGCGSEKPIGRTSVNSRLPVVIG